MEDKKGKINYWFFSKLSKHELEKDVAKFYFETRRNFKGQINDKIVFLTKSLDGFSFSHTASIDSIKQTKMDDDNLSSLTINFKNIVSFEIKNYLNDYAYTLSRIKNFNNPSRHFRLPYGRLEEVEYEALIQSNFFIPRTKFGKYINALPKEHKIAFIQYFIQVNADLYFNDNKDYDEALKILEEYIEYRITQPAKYLKEGYSLLSNMISKEEINRIGFSNYEKKVDYFETQYMRCEEYINLINKEDFTESASFDYKFEKPQHKFERLFKRTPWPIIID